METYFGEIQQARSRMTREGVLASLHRLDRDTEALLAATAHSASKEAKEIRARITATLARAKATCDELTRSAIVTAQGAAGEIDTFIRKYPYHPVGLAFGAGFLIGVLLVRGNRQPEA
jgi:ElaB/YqjD/DUF883 family membrane-anchored ribosome-binding protein